MQLNLCSAPFLALAVLQEMLRSTNKTMEVLGIEKKTAAELQGYVCARVRAVRGHS